MNENKKNNEWRGQIRCKVIISGKTLFWHFDPDYLSETFFFDQFGFKSELTPWNGSFGFKSELTPWNGSSFSLD